ncbi:hypothetical protein BDB01DRAFT_837281 [Pilobolus umbonatus]|nr:hypothetical protein BDB01DRAFT_837281 [Pilobolus umbonatus]
MKFFFLLIVSILSLTVFASIPEGKTRKLITKLPSLDKLPELCEDFCQSKDYMVLVTGLCCCFSGKRRRDNNLFYHSSFEKQYDKKGKQVCKDPLDPLAEQLKRQRSPDRDDEDDNDRSRKELFVSNPVKPNEAKRVMGLSNILN